MRRFALVGFVFMMTVAAFAAAFEVVSLARGIAGELDRATALARLAPRAQATIVYDRAGHQAFSFFAEQRVDVPISAVAPTMVDALLAVEDRRFYSHHGIDPVRVVASAWRNFRAGRIVQGGSTITQQLARASQLSPVRTYERKLREIALAARLEERYSKTEILEEYLNTVYFGDGYYGVEAASRGYFGKSASQLAPAEAALLAALVRSPSTDAPSVAPARAMKRRNLVLRLMEEQGKITAAQLQAALATPVPGRDRRASGGTVLAADAPASGRYFEEEVRRQLVALFGSDRVLRGGLRVHTTYDPALQRAAEQAVRTRIAQIVKMRPAARDLQGSFVAMDPATGDVLALVGGRSFEASSFNRATQARRQAGSAFKPIIYAAALERGYAPGTVLRDLDTPIESPSGAWLPSGEHERTEYTLRRALKVSSNRAAAQLLQLVGLGTATYYAQRLGIESPLPMVPSLALGTGEVTLLELTAAYSAFANRGTVSAPRLITRVEDAHGSIVYETPERHAQAISPTTAFLMSSMLSDVVSGGTATGVRAAGFKLPAAGKTGTTDDYSDAWFVGYTPHLLAGVWFGLDRPAPIMRGGFAGVVAVPAWGAFMRAATTGAKAEWYDTPADVEKVAICRLSGARATDACRHSTEFAALPLSDTISDSGIAPAPAEPGEPPVYEDYFPIGSVPEEPCPIHGTSAGSAEIVATTGTSPSTPMVDAALQHASIVSEPSPVTVRSPRTRIVVEKSVGSDGVLRYTMRQIH
ncbi:MAG TPA: PBP1A family penicillin-binding protein [Vicinamibacterales bacterium]